MPIELGVAGVAQSNRHANRKLPTVSANPLPTSHSTLPANGWLEKLTAGFYGLLTFLPPHPGIAGGDRMLLWQVGLLCPLVWLLAIVGGQRVIPRLGRGWDTIALLWLLNLVVSTVFAESPNWALEYAIATVGYLGAIYALKHWLQTPQHRYQLLCGQGYLSLAFILCSLLGWTIQTVFPVWQRQDALKLLGVEEIGRIPLAPNGVLMGNPEAVAAYLMLVLPLLLGLAMVDRGGRRALWALGVGLGSIDLYTTHSSSAWLGLSVLGVYALGTIAIPRRGWQGVGWVALFGGLLLLLARTISEAMFARTVTLAAGWQMVRSHLWTGVGLGGVPLLYPQYRPFWGGRDAMWTGQLHSTPLQWLAELGIGGAILALVAIGLFGYQGMTAWVRSRPLEALSWVGEPPSPTESRMLSESLLPVCLGGGMVAYGVVSLWDTSLHLPAIAGTAVIYLAVPISRWRTPPLVKGPTLIFLAGLGFLGAAIVWLIPVHQAGYLGARGLGALRRVQPDVATAVGCLTRSHQLVPWKSEYPLQMGWLSGSLHWQDPKPPKQANDWLQRGIAADPNGVFGYNRAGWLLLKTDPLLATKAFGRSAQLIGAQYGVFYGLGRALLASGQMDLAIEAFALELLRNPAFMTHPLWRQLDLEPLFGRVGDRLEEKYAILLKTHTQPSPLNATLHQNRGSFRWWIGNYKGAREDLQDDVSPVSKLVLQLASLESSESVETELRILPPSPAKWAIEAWSSPPDRLKRLQQAWTMIGLENLAPDIVEKSLTTMNSAQTFDEWLKQSSPTAESSLFQEVWTPWGDDFKSFAIQDFPQVLENTAIAHFFANQLWQAPADFPELDLALQLWREALLSAALQKE